MSFIQDNIVIIRDIFSFVRRYGLVFLMGFAALWFLSFDYATLRTIYQIVLYESIALALSGVALFAYTKFNFTNLLMYGRDGVANSIEQTNVLRLLGNIILAVHILVLGIVVGTYLGNMGVIPNPGELGAIPN